MAESKEELIRELESARAELMGCTMGMSENEIEQPNVVGEWSVKDVLAHVLFWEEWGTDTCKALLAGEEVDLTPLEDYDAANAQAVAEYLYATFGEVVEDLTEAFTETLAFIRATPWEELARQRPNMIEDGKDWTIAGWYEGMARHDREHTAEIRAWRNRENIV